MMPIETFASERRAANLEREFLLRSRQERLDYFLRFYLILPAPRWGYGQGAIEGVGLRPWNPS